MAAALAPPMSSSERRSRCATGTAPNACVNVPSRFAKVATVSHPARAPFAHLPTRVRRVEGSRSASNVAATALIALDVMIPKLGHPRPAYCAWTLQAVLPANAKALYHSIRRSAGEAVLRSSAFNESQMLPRNKGPQMAKAPFAGVTGPSTSSDRASIDRPFPVSCARRPATGWANAKASISMDRGRSPPTCCCARIRMTSSDSVSDGSITKQS